MKTKIYSLFAILTLSVTAWSQGVGINETGSNPDPSAILDVESTDKGFLPPRMTEAQRDGITSPAKGLIVYNTDEDCIQVNNGTPASPNWQCLGAVTSYQSMRGKVTILQAATYTVQPDDYTIVTNHNAQCTITFPTLTNSAEDIGRTVHVFNNNTVTGSTLYVGVIGNTVTNQFRGRTFVWTGTVWVIIGL